MVGWLGVMCVCSCCCYCCCLYTWNVDTGRVVCEMEIR